MDFECSEKCKDILSRVRGFMDEHVYPNEHLFKEQIAANHWSTTPLTEELKVKAKEQGLWNLFLPATRLPKT